MTDQQRTVTLPDGYRGSTELFFVEPLERDAACVKLQCAVPGKHFLITWRTAADVDAAVALTEQST